VANDAPIAFFNSIAANLRAGSACSNGQSIGVLVVGVDYGDARSGVDRAVEQQALGGEVLLHGLVIVEVVAGEVGEHCDVESYSGGPALIEPWLETSVTSSVAPRLTPSAISSKRSRDSGVVWIEGRVSPAT